MRLVQAEADGTIRYGYPAAWVNRAAGDRLILSASWARIGAPETERYVAHVGRALDTDDGQFLYHFSADDLIDRRARIMTAYRGRIADETLVAARYTVLDADGQLWFRGAFVGQGFKGRGIAPAMAVVGLVDRSRLGQQVLRGTCAVIVDADGRANPRSVAALAKIGFRLGDREDVSDLAGSPRDRHLLRWSDQMNGRAVMRYRRMYLEREDFPLARRFLERWGG